MPRHFTTLLFVLLCIGGAAAETSNDDAKDKGITLSQTPAVIFLILYLVAALAQWIQYFRNPHRPRAYMLSLTIGMSCMMLGMGLRASNNYAWQFLLTFLSPCAFLAADYMVLKHLARAIGKEAASACLFLPPRAITWIFLLADVTTFSMQTVGTVFVIMGSSWLSLGEKLAIGGLVLQLLSFGLFTILLYIFARRLSYHYPGVWRSPSSHGNFFNCWSTLPVDDVSLLVHVLGATCIGILIRSIFRLVEQCNGFFGYIATHEIFFYLFDATPLFLAMVLFCFVWPTRYIAGTKSARTEAEAGDGRVWKAEEEVGRVEMGPFADGGGVGGRR